MRLPRGRSFSSEMENSSDSREDDIAYEPDPERVLKILDETVGGWTDLDIDKIFAEIYEARRVGSRPPDRP